MLLFRNLLLVLTSPKYSSETGNQAQEILYFTVQLNFNIWHLIE
jgi:hypothetical protein